MKKSKIVLLGAYLTFSCVSLLSMSLVQGDAGPQAPDSFQPPAQLTRWQSDLACKPVQLDYFGLHIHHADTEPWPAVPFGTFRLWDTHVAWLDLEPTKGNWNFSRLDMLVSLAAQHHVQLVLPLAMTPQWASARPDEQSFYKNGNAAEPRDMNDWDDYVRTVMKRYKGKIAFYEIWNEVNLKGFYSGTPDKLVELEKRAYAIMKQTDPAARMISVNVTAPYGIGYFKQLLSLGYADYADIIGYHFYVSPAGPEAIWPLAMSLEKELAARGIYKPLWNTETGWHPPFKFAKEDSQAGVLVRALLAARSAGASRFIWYAWDNRGWVSLFLTENDSVTPTRAAQAYANLEKWLVGNTLKPCALDQKTGIWSCAIHMANGQDAEVVWSPADVKTVSLDSDHVETEDMYGTKTVVTTRSFNCGAYPALLYGHHRTAVIAEVPFPGSK